MPLTDRPVAENDLQLICGFPQNDDELFFLFPKAVFPLTPSQLRDAIAQRADSTVVELDGQVVAFANFYRWEVDGCCSIGNVIVSPAARGHGVGRYLIERMIDLAFSRYQATEVKVSCFNQNVAGLLLYLKLDFQPYAVEERKDKKGNRVALIHMRLPRNATYAQPDLRDVTHDDLPLIERWLHADHVRSTWGDPDANLRLLSEPPAKGNWRAIIEADGRPVGIVLWQHPTREELDVAGLADIPTSAIDIDIMIGEFDALGRGLGSNAIRRVAEAALSDPAVPFVMACTGPDNLASQRAFAKAGFRRDREFDDVPNGLHVLMVRHRQERQNT